MNPIKRGRKRKARAIREGKGYQENPDGSRSTHLMATYEGETKNGKPIHYVAPTIAPDSSGKYKEQSFEEAMDKGEVFQFKSQKAAERFAKGSWKKKRDRK
jgi:hypothetical protein